MNVLDEDGDETTWFGGGSGGCWSGGYFVATILWLFCNLRQYEHDRQNYDPPHAAARPRIV